MLRHFRNRIRFIYAWTMCPNEKITEYRYINDQRQKILLNNTFQYLRCIKTKKYIGTIDTYLQCQC